MIFVHPPVLLHQDGLLPPPVDPWVILKLVKVQKLFVINPVPGNPLLFFNNFEYFYKLPVDLPPNLVSSAGLVQ